MTDEQDSASGSSDIVHLAQTLPLESHISHSQHFIDQQNLRFQVSRYRKGQAYIHPTGVMLDWCIQKFIDLGKSHDLIQFTLDFGLFHTENGAIQVHILTSGQFWMET